MWIVEAIVFATYQFNLCILDISVFSGARSDVNQSNWFWENRTMVDDSNYPTSDPSVCQQMSLPLTYDDGINLLPKDCENDEAHYVCEIPCKIPNHLREACAQKGNF